MNEDQENQQNETKELFIHIQWSGPYPFKEGEHLKGTSNYGIYQIYGHHPVYGSGVLLYIGRNEWQCFSDRGVSEHGEHLQNQDAGCLELYVGRLIGRETPTNEKWNEHIRLAERLLIHAHRPAWNSQMELGDLEKELRYVHVVNWCQYRSLMAEVSGARWTTRFDEIKFGQFYDTEHFGQPTQVMNEIPK